MERQTEQHRVADNAASRTIATILRHDRKQNSYKLALIRAINDVVLSFPDAGTHGSHDRQQLRKTNTRSSHRGALLQHQLALPWNRKSTFHTGLMSSHSTRRAGTADAHAATVKERWNAWTAALPNAP